jgi:hypothetical protein
MIAKNRVPSTGARRGAAAVAIPLPPESALETVMIMLRRLSQAGLCLCAS